MFDWVLNMPVITTVTRCYNGKIRQNVNKVLELPTVKKQYHKSLS